MCTCSFARVNDAKIILATVVDRRTSPAAVVPALHSLFIKASSKFLAQFYRTAVFLVCLFDEPDSFSPALASRDWGELSVMTSKHADWTY